MCGFTGSPWIIKILILSLFKPIGLLISLLTGINTRTGWSQLMQQEYYDDKTRAANKG
jgi:hypothetical protein